MMTAVFLKLFNMSVTASFLVLAVICLRFLMRKAPKWIFCLLWGVVALRLVMPFSIESVFSLIPSAEPIPQNITSVQTPMIDSGIPVLNNAVNPIISDLLAPVAGTGESPVRTLVSAASIVWAVGVGAVAVFGAVSYIKLKRRVRASLLYRDNIYYCDDIDTPFILGVIRPKIYIPSGLTDAQVGYIIAHETAHLKRGDHLWKPLGFALLAVYWLNPAIWAAYFLLCRDIETACDERVIRNMDNADKRGYSEALVSCSVRRRTIMACPLAFGEVGVKNRIKSVLNYKKPGFWIIILAVVAGAVVAVCFLTNPKGEASPDGDTLLNTSVTLDPVELVSSYEGYSFVQTADAAPEYRIGNDMSLYEIHDNGIVYLLGKLEETELDGNNFDSRFLYSRWSGGHTLESVKKNNKRAWELHCDPGEDLSYLYILLEQNDGTFFLGFGYYNYQSDEPQNSDDSFVRWLYRMTVSDSDKNTATEQLAVDGAMYLYSVPVLQTDVPEYDGYYLMTASELRGLTDILGEQKWHDDSLTDRIAFYFDGQIRYDGRWIYFGYEQNIIYCDGHFCEVSDDTVSYIRGLTSKAEDYPTDGSSDTDDIVVDTTETVYFPLENMSAYGIPRLTVYCGDLRISAWTGTVSWTYAVGDGTFRALNADGSHPLEMIENIDVMPVTAQNSDAEPPAVTLDFDIPPDRIKVNSWFFTEAGGTESFDADVDGFRINLTNVGTGCLYEVVAEWTSSGKYNGTVHYAFRTEAVTLENASGTVVGEGDTKPTPPASNPVPVDLSVLTEDELSHLSGDARERLTVIHKAEPAYYSISFTPAVTADDVDGMVSDKLSEYTVKVAEYEEKGRDLAARISDLDAKITDGKGDTAALTAERDTLSSELEAVQKEAERYAVPQDELYRLARNELFDEYNGKLIRDFAKRHGIEIENDAFIGSVSCTLYCVELTADKIVEILKSGDVGYRIACYVSEDYDH